MKKRSLCVILALVMALCCTPCLAAEPDWNGPLGPEAMPTLCDTGRGYIVYYWYVSAIYYSPDGVTWTDLSDRSWAQEAAPYTHLGVGHMGHREFEFLWTGSEYLMRQSLLDDPRSTHSRLGDSPRNNIVTLLDADFQVTGQVSFDGPVTGIRYEDGICYATVDGTETAFSPAEPALTGFSDVAPGDWFAPYVEVCVEEGLMQGTGAGRFDPGRELTQAECMTLAYRLYDRSQGGDGSVDKAPGDWNRFTLTLANGVEITGYGNLEMGAGPFSYFDGYSDVGCLTADLYYGEGVPDAVEGNASVTLNGKTYPGLASFVNVNAGLTFFPDGYPSDPEAVKAYETIQRAADGVDPKFWWRDVCFTVTERGWDPLLPSWKFTRFPAYRWDFSMTLAEVAGELEQINTVPELPDLVRDPYSEGIYRLYEAGILTGVDELGTFQGGGTLTRAEAAAMLARVIRPELRIHLEKIT